MIYRLVHSRQVGTIPAFKFRDYLRQIDFRALLIGGLGPAGGEFVGVGFEEFEYWLDLIEVRPF